MDDEISRRAFLRGAGAVAATLVLSRLELACTPDTATPAANGRAPDPHTGSAPGPSLPDYRSWEDVYRQRWTWDRVVKGTHIRTNCIAACSWNVFVKDSVAWREEQNTIYEPSHPNVPDMNPRGCQKGGCYSQLMYEPSRLKYPLRRIGERGSGKWQRLSWDDALTQVADTLLDVALRDGPDTIVYDH